MSKPSSLTSCKHWLPVFDQLLDTVRGSGPHGQLVDLNDSLRSVLRPTRPLVILCPHADDGAITAACLLHDYAVRRGLPVIEVLVYAGERNVAAPWLDNRKKVTVREAEFHLESNVLGAEGVCWDLEGYRMPGYEPTAADIEKVVDWFQTRRPGAVIVPPCNDAHVAHRVTRALAAIGLVGANLGDCLVLTGWTPWGPLSQPNAYFPYDGEAERTKEWAIHCHASQVLLTDYTQYCSHLGRAYAALVREWAEGHSLAGRAHRTDDRFVGVELFQIESYDARKAKGFPADPIQIALGILSGDLAADGADPLLAASKTSAARRPTHRPSPVSDNVVEDCTRMLAQARRYAGMEVSVLADADLACRAAATRLRNAILTGQSSRRAVLGLATGSTPEKVYAHLVQWSRDGSLTFRNATTYNLDEYYPISPLDPQSYRAYMHRHLFGHVDIAPDHAHVLDGSVPEAFTAAHAAEFDRWIEADGGLDIQLLGIGRNGHIGFNEPSALSVADAMRLPTRLIELHPVTRADAAKEFGGTHRVIPRALTMGVATILGARSIVMLATGAHKAEVVARALTGPMTAEVPASLLQSVADRVTWLIDEPAAAGLL